MIDGLGGDGDGFDPQAIYKEEAPGVVTVVSLFGGESLEDLGDASGGVGSGFVLNGDGEIATNAHVVTTGEVPDLREARTVYVEFADGNQVEAEVKGYDPESDVALLEVDPKGLTLRPLPLGGSETVKVGTPVAAIGSPFSERQSLSVGVVSAVDRSITGLTAFQIAGAIQTDAAINPGNSGGPLVDADGKVIGINQQIKTNSGGGEGVGFAVPVDVARRALDAAAQRGQGRLRLPRRRDRGDLPAAARALRPPGRQGRVGAGRRRRRAGRRTPGCAAAATSETVFQVRSYRDGGDVITSIDGRPVDDPDDLSRAVALLDPGATVTVEAWRDGERREVRVKLGEPAAVRPA